MLARTTMPLLAMTLCVFGCGVDDGQAKKAGRAVGETLTDFASGVGSGVDKRLAVEVELSEGIEQLGLEKTVAKSASSNRSSKAIAVYFISQHPVQARLVARALDAQGQEIGRSVVPIDFAEDDAKYVTFPFDGEMDSQLVNKYVIDARPMANEEAPPPVTEAKEAVGDD